MRRGTAVIASPSEVVKAPLFRIVSGAISSELALPFALQDHPLAPARTQKVWTVGARRRREFHTAAAELCTLVHLLFQKFSQEQKSQIKLSFDVRFKPVLHIILPMCTCSHQLCSIPAIKFEQKYYTMKLTLNENEIPVLSLCSIRPTRTDQAEFACNG